MERSNLHHVMFDIDGTLLKSYDLDSRCFIDSIKFVTGVCVDTNWSKYRHVTDSGILEEIIDVNEIINKQETMKKVKSVFIEKLEQSIANEPIQEVPGAAEFLTLLNSMSDVVVSLATGGWYESAALKLSSVGIDFSSIPLASSTDNISRTEIMKTAVSRIPNGKDFPCTYFGDGSWDKEACEQMGFNFVLVGNRLIHKPNITNFLSIDEAMACIGFYTDLKNSERYVLRK